MHACEALCMPGNFHAFLLSVDFLKKIIKK